MVSNYSFLSFRELIISRGCCNDSLSSSRKAGDSSEKTQGLEGRGGRKEGRVHDINMTSGYLLDFNSWAVQQCTALLPKKPTVPQSGGSQSTAFNFNSKMSSISRIDGQVLLWTLGWPLEDGLCYC